MAIHAICLAKNEADIIEQTLRAASRWCNHIYVYDNGSDDGTWEQVQRLAWDCSQVIPYRQEAKPFRDSLRAEVFRAYRHRSNDGDWWCRLDADEFYVDDPRAFLPKVPRRYNVVWSASLSYYFTDKDAALYRQNPSLYADHVPIEEKCRYYVNHWSEPRFFRYRSGLVWEDDHGGYPAQINSSPGYPVRIRLKHFPYRSPEQMEKRLRTRRPAMNEGEFIHEFIPNWSRTVENIRFNRERGLDRASLAHANATWEQRIVEASCLDYDAHDGRYILNEDLMPAIPRPRSPMRKAARLLVAGLKSIVPERRR